MYSPLVAKMYFMRLDSIKPVAWPHYYRSGGSVRLSRLCSKLSIALGPLIPHRPGAQATIGVVRSSSTPCGSNHRMNSLPMLRLVMPVTQWNGSPSTSIVATQTVAEGEVVKESVNFLVRHVCFHPER